MEDAKEYFSAKLKAHEIIKEINHTLHIINALEERYNQPKTSLSSLIINLEQTNG